MWLTVSCTDGAGPDTSLGEHVVTAVCEGDADKEALCRGGLSLSPPGSSPPFAGEQSALLIASSRVDVTLAGCPKARGKLAL